ncbi:hypothetical protein [Sporosarcina sp. FSL W7-1283]|uniref:hypothetical protein n=1 Tax=Sporosarcina sp. FSL W7-1283 TaxID=2921560 RepID=UPI0030F6EE37
MTNHDYMYDINSLISKSKQLGMDSLESYALQLDDSLYNMKTITPEFELLLNHTLEFLHGLVDNYEEAESY